MWHANDAAKLTYSANGYIQLFSYIPCFWQTLSDVAGMMLDVLMVLY